MWSCRKSEGQVVAGHAAAQPPALDDRLEPRGRLCLQRKGNEEEYGSKARDRTRHQEFSRLSLTTAKCERMDPQSNSLYSDLLSRDKGSQRDHFNAPGIGWGF